MSHGRQESAFLNVLSAVLLLAPQHAFAVGDLRPEWLRDPVRATPNCSYLEAFQPKREQSLEDQIFNPKLTTELKQQYEDMNRDYEMRKYHALVSHEEQREHAERQSSFGRFFLRSLFNFHVTKQVDEAQKHSEEIRTFKELNDTVQRVVQKGVDVKVNESTKLGTKIDIPHQKGRFWVTSPVINGSFETVLGAPSSRDPLAPRPADPLYREERYRVSLSRGLPIWDLNSSVSYGSTSTMMTAALSKQFSSNLACVVDHTQPVSVARSEIKYSEDTARLVYEKRF